MEIAVVGCFKKGKVNCARESYEYPDLIEVITSILSLTITSLNKFKGYFRTFWYCYE